MLSMVLVLAVAAGNGSCAEHRAAAGSALLSAVEAEAYADAAVDFEWRIDELGLAGSTLAREEALAVSLRADELDPGASLVWGGRDARRTARIRSE